MSVDEKKKLGRILLKRKLVSPEQLESALERQRSSPPGTAPPLASMLTDSGLLSEADAIRALSEQFGIPGLDLSKIVIDLSHLDFVPQEIAVDKRLLPVLVQDDHLFLAMANPSDQKAIDELEFVTGRRVRAYVAITAVLEKATKAAYSLKESGGKYFIGPNVPPETRAQLGEPVDNIKVASVPPPPSDGSIANSPPFSENLGPSDWSTIALLPKDDKKKSNAKARTILIVDDEADIRKLLSHVLAGDGHTIYEADRGLLALELVKQHTPDLIILDAMLPELHGFEIARRLKASERYSKIPILMLSAVHRGWRVAEDAKSNLGIDEYMEKPFRISEAKEAIERLLTRSGPAEPARDPEAIAEEAKKLVDKSTESYKAGRVEEAISFLRRAADIDPLAFRPHYHLGLLFAKVGRSFDALTELERAVELHPRSFVALKNLAVLYEQAGFQNKAIEMWERCIQTTEDATVQKEIREHLLSLL